MNKRVSTQGIVLNVRDEGAGRPPLVFIHGMMCSGRFFDAQVPYFSGRYRVVVPDLRGHGNSDKPLSGYTVSNYATDLRSIIEEIGLERPVLVGWSMGSMVAYEYLKLFGQEDIAGLVVVDQPPSDFAWDGYQFGFFTVEVLGQTLEHIQMHQRELAEQLADLMLHAPSPEVTGWIVEELMKVPPVIASTALVDQTVRDYRPFLPEIKCPTLVLFGEDPKLTSPDAGRYIAEEIPNATYQGFANSSHCPFFEEPEAFNESLDRFLAQLLVGGPERKNGQE